MCVCVCVCPFTAYYSRSRVYTRSLFRRDSPLRENVRRSDTMSDDTSRDERVKSNRRVRYRR